MPMSPFVSRFPELGPRETRSVEVPDGKNLPAGSYGFLELYCDEPGCDCRRVVIQVLRPETAWSKVWATIGYGWDKPQYYRKLFGTVGESEDLTGPYLDPFNQQSRYAPALLDLFRWLLETPEYVERLKRHYRMFRQAVDEERGQNRQQRKQPRASTPRRRRR